MVCVRGTWWLAMIFVTAAMQPVPSSDCARWVASTASVWSKCRRSSWMACASAAPIAIALWLVAMTVHYDEFPLIQSAHGLHQSPLHTFVATLAFVGGACIFPGAVRLGRKYLAPLLAIAAVISFLAPLPTLWARAWFAAFAFWRSLGGQSLIGADETA